VSDAELNLYPRVFLLDPQLLPHTRRRVIEVDEALEAADRQLLEDAELAMGAGPFSVVDKQVAAPSGDEHDYVSHSPYWWPDPDAKDGLPFVRKDGEANLDREKADREALAGLISTANTLGLAYYLSDHERFAQHLARLLRTWFVDPSTRMNPHLQFAQAIPGVCERSSAGIIDMAQLPSVLDSVALLAASTAWSSDDDDQLRQWCKAFLSWLTQSDQGREEAAKPDHHGTWYDVQVLALAAFLDDQQTGQRIAAAAAARIDSQIDPDGSQPRELQRTKSLSYCVMNLLGFCDLATLAAHFGIDLWQHEGTGGRSLRNGVRFLIDAAIDSEWLHPQIEPFDHSHFLPLLRRTALALHEPEFEARILKLREVEPAADRTQLLYPSV
jgi:hypothetical protein